MLLHLTELYGNKLLLLEVSQDKQTWADLT